MTETTTPDLQNRNTSSGKLIYQKVRWTKSPQRGRGGVQAELRAIKKRMYEQRDEYESLAASRGVKF